MTRAARAASVCDGVRFILRNLRHAVNYKKVKAMIFKRSILITKIVLALSSGLASAEPVNHEKAIQFIVCAAVYRTTESMLLIPATGKTSNETLSALLRNKQKVHITKAIQASSRDFVRETREKVVDRLIDRTMDEYAVSINKKTINKETSYSDFLLKKYDGSCTALAESN